MKTGNTYIIKSREKTNSNSETEILDLDLRQKKLAEQLELLCKILKNICFEEKPHFLPFVKDKYLFDMVSEPYELIESFRLRFLSYSSEDTAYINPKLFPLGLELDKYDQVSTHFYARNLENNKMCGYIRMINDTSLGLQLEIKLDIYDYRSKYKICEVSRYTTYPRHQPIIRKMLLENLKRYAKEKGVEKILGEGRLVYKQFFDSVGSVPMRPFRSWKLRDKEEWGSQKDEIIYGNVIHLNQEGDK